ncbi:MAG: GNAT family N-acetyltransferase [Crocinitomicaceae bacterium]|nr:GNAT family N-acetyltransferase [Crocinitomicaceae bacterium]MBK8924477.1 GNAT family N-acetyltransferase [Crocinitomicaceae bacterium]
MKLILSKDIDQEKWNRRIANWSGENIFMYTWYLDAVCNNWGGLVEGDYETILPISFTSRLGIKQFVQAPFTREYDIVGDQYNWEQALQFLSKEFKTIRFRNGSAEILKNKKLRRHQFLSLLAGIDEVKKNYSTNAKRILKKCQNFKIEESFEPEILLELFKKYVAPKIETITSKDIRFLHRLMLAAIQNKSGELLLVKEQNEIVAGGFFLKDKNRITYLKGAGSESAKKAGALYFLIDQAIVRYQNYGMLDFGGSDIAPVAEFYHKFGSTDRVYYEYEISDLPVWFKTLKKIRR